MVGWQDIAQVRCKKDRHARFIVYVPAKKEGIETHLCEPIVGLPPCLLSRGKISHERS